MNKKTGKKKRRSLFVAAVIAMAVLSLGGCKKSEEAAEEKEAAKTGQEKQPVSGIAYETAADAFVDFAWRRMIITKVIMHTGRKKRGAPFTRSLPT